MSFRKSVRKKRVLALTALVLALTAATALAATITGDGTIVGTSGNDTLKAGPGKDTIYGLAGQDKITAGNGNDTIDGDGICPPGVQSGDYPNGLPAGQYCEDGQIAGDGGDSISAGNGNDTVFAGGGHNAIFVGGGKDTIYGGPEGDAISAGWGYSVTDQVYLGRGSKYTGSAVAVGTGSSTIHAQNGVRDAIQCQKPNSVTVYVDKSDVVKDCAQVINTPDPNPGPNPLPAHDRRNAKQRKHAKRAHNHRHSAHPGARP